MESSAEIKETQTEATPQGASAQAQKIPKIPKTTGEKWFKVLRFAVAETMILGLTAGIAFIAWHGKEKYGPVPNYLKKMQEGFQEWLEPLKHKGETGPLFVAAASGTMVTFWGGNLFAPVMKWMQDKRENIITAINRRWGKPGEVEQGHERLRHETKESWGDVIKGRIAAWLIVFSSFFSADVIAGKDKEGLRHFDKFTARAGRWVAGVTKEGKNIAKTPLKELIEHPPANKPYQFGKILALDIFATTAAIAIWTAVSKFSAILRNRRGVVAEEAGMDEIARHTAGKSAAATSDATASAAGAAEPDEKVSHTSRIGERPADYRGLAEREPGSPGMGVS
jgi:hypothetical protein